jgi:hypothetical protein
MRHLIRNLALPLFAAALLASPSLSAPRNVVFILADDLIGSP